ncbi:transglycosylase SLT domain-containing protein, partial [Cellulophaga sp. BC115SP]|uniref:transglycosylase SLT domain-containing protein n=1 Tax=Cellulophaga sp. BC115SP TaxID=2683263 RepID=UPI001412526D
MLPFEWLTYRNPYGYISKVRDVAQRLKIKPEWLMMVIWVESKHSSQAENKLSEAFGLIQCLPSTLRRLGYSLGQVRGKFGEWQLEHLVYPYLKPYIGKMNSAYDVYLAIFHPAALGKGDGYVIAYEREKAYQYNKVLDTVYGDRDGKLEVLDVKFFFKKSVQNAVKLHKKLPEYKDKIP